MELDAWLAPFRRFWAKHLDALETHLDNMDDMDDMDDMDLNLDKPALKEKKRTKPP